MNVSIKCMNCNSDTLFTKGDYDISELYCDECGHVLDEDDLIDVISEGEDL